MNNKNNIPESDELRKLAPRLHEINKETNFSVPPGYFDKFPLLLKDKIDRESKPGLDWVVVFGIKSIISVVACIVLVVICFYYFDKSGFDGSMEELTAKEIKISLENYGYHSLNEEMLANAVYGSENGDMDLVKSNGLSEEEIIDYLLEYNIDENLLYNEF